MDQVSNKFNQSLQKIKLKKVKNDTDTVNLYESDIMNELLSDDDENEQQEEEEEAEEEEESFNDLIKEIDTDAFTVAMGGVFTEITLYAITGVYIQLDSDEGSQDDEGESELETNAQYIAIAVLTTVGVVMLTFYLFTKLISYIQMTRDKILHQMFIQLQNRSLNSNDNVNMKIGDLTINENCCISGCIKFSYKSYRLSQHTIVFIIGFLGWAFAWAATSGMYATNQLMTRFYFSLTLTGLGTFVFWSIP